MATSGSTDFESTRNELIYAALRKCGQLADGEVPTAETVENASKDLERMIKGWQADGVHVWKLDEIVVFLSEDQQLYEIGPTGDRAVVKSEVVFTETTADAVSTDTSITVDDASDILINDVIGIVLDDATIHWTTVSLTPVTDVVTFADALPDDVTTANAVYVYSSLVSRPLRITQGRLQVDTANETELTPIGREDYFRLANKTASGNPTQFYYSPTTGNGKLYIWPVCSADERLYLNMTCYLPIMDFDASSTNGDFPVEWEQPIVWNLAREIGPDFGVDDSTFAKIEKMADYWLTKVKDFDVDDDDIIIGPNFEY